MYSEFAIVMFSVKQLKYGKLDILMSFFNITTIPLSSALNHSEIGKLCCLIIYNQLINYVIIN